MDLAVIETVDNALCWVRQLGSDAPSPARLPPELVARAWEPASGDLVALDGGIIGYMWRRAIVVRERGDGGLVVRPTGRENPNGTIAWTIRALSSTLSAGDAVFLDARVGRWVAVDRAQAALPAHPSRLLHGYDPIKDEVRALAVWRRPAGPLHADMIEVTEEVVRRLLGRQFPSWADLPLARVASTGTVHAIYRLGDDMAVRLPLSPRFEGIRQEFEDLGKFGPLLPIPIPEPVALGEPDECFELPWGILRWLPGRPWQKGLVDDEIAEAHRLADFLHVLQALPTEGAPPAWFAAPGKALRTSAPAVEAALLASYGLAPVDAIRAAWLKALELHDWEGAGVWLHGDLLPGNFLVHGGRIAAVIDWGTPGLGDPARDLMPAWTLLAPAGRAAFRSCFSYDSDVWRRARAMVFTRISNVPYYWETNRGFADEALENIGAALDDDPDTWEE